MMARWRRRLDGVAAAMAAFGVAVAALAAAAALGDDDGVEELLLPKMAVWEKENSWYGEFLTT